MKKSIYLFIFLSLFLFGVSAGAEVVVFERDLKLRDTGPDVKNLQIVLNSNLETRVAIYGPGSPGNETEYFGLLTYRAVEKFQNLYKDEILTPLGLENPTGYVGPSTREKLNEIAPEILGLTDLGVSDASGSGSDLSSGNDNTDSGSSSGSSDAITDIGVGLGSTLLTSAISNYLSDGGSASGFASLYQPFGGQILEVFPCSCSNNIMLTVGPPKGGEFMLEPSSIIYDYGNVSTPGVWVLGLYEPVGICLVPSGDGCAPLPNSGSIYSIGTSAY